MKEDLEMWLQFLSHFNGVVYFVDRFCESNNGLERFTDAAGSFGYGGYFKGHWFCGEWPVIWRNNAICRDSTFLECFLIVAAVIALCHLLRNR